MRIIACLFFNLLLQGLLAQAPPNILWIVCEDISPTLSFYGDSTAQTPVLNALARESMVYENAFATVGVCAPSRSSIITGMYPTSIGTMHMRTGKDITSWGKRKYKDRNGITDIIGDSIREYSVVLPEEVKCFPEYLRAAGYYCTNNNKTDYQFAAPLTAWDENNAQAHWRNRPDGKPFFSVFNINVTHESRLWKNKDLPLTVAPENVPVPPYLPDNVVTRKDIARHYSNVELMDAEVGKILEELKEDGLLDKTVIFFYSDHGGPLPRQKREAYDSGLKVPFLVRAPERQEWGRTDRLISFVDLGPTVLSLAGITPPEYMEGKAFLGEHASSPRTYVFASSDRFDEYTDRTRIIRDDRWLYVRNFFPDLRKYKDLGYRKNIPMMKELLDLKDRGLLNPVQSQWFGSKNKEELYDCIRDPHNIHNLADDPDFQTDLQRMKSLFWRQMSESPDLGQVPEATLIDMMWPNGQQPITESPEVLIESDKILLTTPTSGASIAYRWSDDPNEPMDFDKHWQLYTHPISIRADQYLYVVAERIGYHLSSVLVKKMEE